MTTPVKLCCRACGNEIEESAADEGTATSRRVKLKLCWVCARLKLVAWQIGSLGE